MLTQGQLDATQDQVQQAVEAIMQYRERQEAVEEELEASRRLYKSTLAKIEMERKREETM